MTAAHKTQNKIQAWSSLVFHCRHSSFYPSEAPQLEGLETSEWRRCRSLSFTPPIVPTALSPAPLVTDSLIPIRHERELSLVLACCVTAAFCVRASDVCAQKTVYQTFELIWFKMYDFRAIYMIIKTKQMFF